MIILGLVQLPASIGYLTYIVIEYNDVYGIIDKFLEIKADPFFLHYLNEFIEKKPSHEIVITVIALFSSTLGLSILSILSISLAVCLAREHIDSNKIENNIERNYWIEEKKENFM